jgi:hypothetical protein
MISLISFDPTSFKVQLGPLVLLALRLSLLSPSLTTSLSIFSLSLSISASLSLSLSMPPSLSPSLCHSLCAQERKKRKIFLNGLLSISTLTASLCRFMQFHTVTKPTSGSPIHTYSIVFASARKVQGFSVGFHGFLRFGFSL